MKWCVGNMFGTKCFHINGRFHNDWGMAFDVSKVFAVELKSFYVYDQHLRQHIHCITY